MSNLKQKINGKIKSNRQCLEYLLIAILTVVGVFYLMSLFLGFRLSDANAYNTYALQADSWRQGRLDLGMDYVWLELAIYNGKYYCSFPPFPSYILFPLTFWFGSQTPDYMIVLALNIIVVIYLYLLALKLGTNEKISLLLTIFVTIGANTLFVMVSPSVWFFAQFICFTTSIMAIYYANEGKGAASLFWWAASVGCRPMQILYLPVLLLILYRRVREEDSKTSSLKCILRRWHWCIPMGCVAVSYMVLNYLRFGNIMEFGHNYLPEFVRAEKGQFHLDYTSYNLPSLLQLPQFNEDGTMVINHFGNLAFYIVSPIVIVAIVGFVYVLCKRNLYLCTVGTIILMLSAIYLFIITMHRTLGAWHFGNRYSIDILPYIYLLVGMILAKYPALAKYCVPFCVFGVCLNMVGTVIVYNGLA